MAGEHTVLRLELRAQDIVDTQFAGHGLHLHVCRGRRDDYGVALVLVGAHQPPCPMEQRTGDFLGEQLLPKFQQLVVGEPTQTRIPCSIRSLKAGSSSGLPSAARMVRTNSLGPSSKLRARCVIRALAEYPWIRVSSKSKNAAIFGPPGPALIRSMSSSTEITDGEGVISLRFPFVGGAIASGDDPEAGARHRAGMPGLGRRRTRCQAGTLRLSL